MKESGKIKTLVQNKGFGFIDMGRGNKDLFFHAKDLQGVNFDELNVGDVVEFEMGESAKGACAKQVELVK